MGQLTSCRFIAALLATLVSVTAPGCQAPRSQNVPANTAVSAARPVVSTKPLVDFSRGAGGFPLVGDALPPTREALVASLTTGYRHRVDPSPDAVAPLVVAVGEDYPNLDSLVMDLSGARIKPGFRPSSFKAAARLGESLRVKHLEYVALPLRYSDGNTNLRIVAHDVTLNLLRGRGETAALVMTEARDGRVDFHVPVRDLERMLVASARTGGAKAGYRISDVSLKLSSDHSHSLACELTVGGWWLLLPTSFKLTGRVDIDDAYNARLSNVGCTGTDVGGALVAGFIDNAVRKYDGRVMPLARFPGGKIRIRDLRIDLDDSLRIFAAFGSSSQRR
jgi:hypothetical protein